MTPGGGGDLPRFRHWLAEQVLRCGSTRQLSARAGLPADTVYRLLTAPTTVPDPGTCEGLARASGIAPTALLRWAGHPPPDAESAG